MRSVRKERGTPAGRLFIICIGVLSMLLRAEAPVSSASGRPGSPGFACGPAATEEAVAALPTYRCRLTPRPISADQMWDDAGWRRAASTGPFLNWDAQGVPEDPTEARLTYDDRALYVAFRCADRDIYSPYQNRDDSLWNEDVVELFLSIPDDPLHYYEFEVSPANVLFDARILNPAASGERTPGDKTWDAEGIKTSVRVEGTLNQRGDTDRSWQVRISLPFTALGLRRAPAPGTTWRVNLYRFDASSRNRFLAWSPTLGTRPNFHRLERFGYLRFDP
jgi:Carbohydrate-binding family 9